MEQRFQDWSLTVVSQIRFKADRPEVRRELEAHLEDKLARLEAASMEHEAAVEQAVAEMGEAEAVGRELDRVHTTAANRLWAISRVVVLVLTVQLLALLLLFPGLTGEFRNEVKFLTNQPFFHGFHELLDPEDIVYGHREADARVGKEFLCYGTATAVTRAGAYNFAIPYACWWRDTESGQDWVSMILYVRDAAFPWTAPEPQLYSNGMFLEDSGGTRYEDYQFTVSRSAGRRLLGEYYYAVTLPMAGTTDWVDLTYDQGDHDWSLRVEKAVTA